MFLFPTISTILLALLWFLDVFGLLCSNISCMFFFLVFVVVTYIYTHVSVYA